MVRLGKFILVLFYASIVLGSNAQNNGASTASQFNLQNSITACVAPAAPTAANVTTCVAGPVTLTAFGGGVGEIYKWFNASIGGDSLFAGDTYVPTISATDTFYVSLTNDTCESLRTQVIAKIAAVPIATTANVTVCSTGEVSLTATGAMEGQDYKWYDAATGGTLLGTGVPFIYSVSSTVTLYVGIAEGACPSPARQPLTVTLTSNPPGPSTTNGSSCGPGNVTLLATSSLPGATFEWYTSLFGGAAIFTGPSYSVNLAATDTFYVLAKINGGCQSSRTFVIGRIKPVPAVPTSPVEPIICPGTASLSATPSPGTTLNWYDSLANGNLLFSGSNFLTPVLTDTTTYYAASMGTNGCESPRIPVRALIKPFAAEPLTSNVERCGSGSILLSAATSPSEAVIKWFATSSGTIPLGTGSDFTTPVLSATTTYYVSATLGDCETARIPVTVTINPNTAAPQTTPGSRCGPGTVLLQAVTNVPGATLYWFDSQNATVPIASGGLFTTPVISTNTTYYVSASIPGCESNRIPVLATIEAGPAAPQSSDVNQCGPGTFLLTATTSVPLAVITWYDSPNAINPVGTGPAYTTPPISATTSFFVSVTLPGCESGRVEVKANVIPNPGQPIVSDVTVCGPPTVVLSSNTGANGARWYDSNTSTTLLSSDPNYTATVETVDTFWVSATSIVSNVTCESTRARMIVTRHSTPSPALAPDVSRCGSGKISLIASGTKAKIYMWWEDNTTLVPLVISQGYQPIVESTTTYFVSYIDSTTGCSSRRDSVNAIVIAPPIVTATAAPSSIVKGDVSKLSATGGGTYAWSPTKGLSGFAGANVDAAPEETTTYKVKVNLNGCIDSAEVSVEVLLTDEVPNLFTPNSDNEHELWEVPGILAYPQSKMLVFNRWGTKVYEASPYKNDWNGGSLPDGTYYYTLEYGSGKSTRTGSVTIVRK